MANENYDDAAKRLLDQIQASIRANQNKPENASNSLFSQEASRMATLNTSKTLENTPWYKTILIYLFGGTILGGVFLFVYTLVAGYELWSAGFVLHKLWEWFVIPSVMLHTFGMTTLQTTGVCVIKSISTVQAMGICLLVRILTHKSKLHTDKDEGKPKYGITLTNMVLFPWVIFLGGYIIHRLF